MKDKRLRRAVCKIPMAVLQSALRLGDEVYPELILQTDADRIEGEFTLVLNGQGLPVSFETDSMAKPAELKWADSEDGLVATFAVEDHKKVPGPWD